MPSKWDYQNAVMASDLPGPARWIAVAISTRADVETCVIPEQFGWSLDELKEATGYSAATVKRHLALLEDRGWMKRSRWIGARTEYLPSIPTGGSERAMAQSEPPHLAQSEPRGAQSEPGAGSERADQGLTVSPSYKDVHQTHPVHQSSPAPGAPADDKPSTKTKRGTRIPDDFHATAEMIAWARVETPLVGTRETEAFVDYWRSKPGQGATKLDWVATWKNWMRRAQIQAEERQHRAQARASPRQSADPAPYHRQWTPEED